MTEGTPAVFSVGRDVFSWIQRGGRPERGGWKVSLLYRWQSFWFERNLALQRRLHPSPDAPALPATSFILGMWRSGTTYIHTLLAQCPGITAPATWQCMNPASFRLRGRPHQSRTVARPMDAVTIDAFSPQEDEWALLALGVPTVYRAFIDPRRLPELARWLEPEAWANERAGWVGTWLAFLTGVVQDAAERLLLKSPGHTFRIEALMEQFPEATYIWMVRDPVEILMSNRKMWSAMFERYALWRWSPSVVDAFLAKAMAHAARSLEIAAQSLSPRRLVAVDFNRFCGSECAILEAVNERLGLGRWEQMRPAVAAALARTAGYTRSSHLHGDRENDEMQQALAHLACTQESALRSHGLGKIPHNPA